MTETRQPNLADPTFEPTDEQINEVLRDAARLARWRAAMAAQGIKVLSMGMSIEDQARLADAWQRETTATHR